MTNPTLPSSLFFKVIFSCLASILILGCAATQPPAPPKPVFFEHKIKFSGETLAAIAGWYTGDAKNWHAIAAANPKLKPNNLQIGDAVEIPENLITQVEELPKKFLKSKNAKAPDDPKKSAKGKDTKESKNTDAAAKSEGNTNSSVSDQEKAVIPGDANNAADKGQAIEASPTVASAVVAPATTPAVAPNSIAPASVSPAPAITVAPTPDPVDSSIESLLMEPTPAAAKLSPEEKAREDLIDEILKK